MAGAGKSCEAAKYEVGVYSVTNHLSLFPPVHPGIPYVGELNLLSVILYRKMPAHLCPCVMKFFCITLTFMFLVGSLVSRYMGNSNDRDTS